MFEFLRKLTQPDPLASPLWPAIGRAMPLLHGLSDEEWARLETRMRHFLRHKYVEGTHELTLTESQRLVIAAQACLPIMNLEDKAYDAWSEVIVYPAAFVSPTQWTDEYGLVHEAGQPVIGMARSDGPLLLSLPDVEQGPWLDGRNVVIHECAHKLDMLNGRPNCFPPLHADMSRKAWNRAFERAYADFRNRLYQGLPVSIDPYGAQDPAEFFAVLSEYFFELPHLLHREYPAVYEQLRQFYRQDPGARLPVIGVQPCAQDELTPCHAG
ncbi:zinc-dependent peptidase [Chitinimonas sp.]|uniref:M90 family metallopeptidase n=1 Tax=Chitinimonas sp. TaxID=1934313 RepID=UPI0035B09A5E